MKLPDVKPVAPSASNDALLSIPSIPQDSDGPVFQEPWQAEVFAMTLSLHEKGLFTWTEWADQLSSCIADAQRQGDPDLGNTYYQHWLNALEKMVVDKELGSTEQLSDLYHQWESAAEATPHGQAIVLKES